jgi:Right handed beta helix region
MRDSHVRGFILITVFALTLCAFAQAANLKVNCNSTGALSTINGALKILNPQGPNTLTVSGSCHENVVIQSFDRLTLIANPGASINDASGGTAAVLDIIDSQRITVQGFTVNGGGEGVVCEGFSLCRFSGNTFQGSSDSGIQVLRSRAHFEGDTSQNNAGDGLAVLQFANVATDGLTVQGNQSLGVRVAAHSTLVATKTTAQSNAQSGMLAVDNSTIILFGSTSRNNGEDGINLSAASLVRFSAFASSIVTNNFRSGVDIADLSFGRFTPGGQAISGNNLGGGAFDVTCRPQFSATRGLANIGGGTTNCVEP